MENGYSILDASKILNVSEITIKRYIKENKIISFKISGKRIIDRDSLEKFIFNQKHKQVLSELEEGVKITYKNDYKNLVNFSENLKLAKHRWFNIKEGYSELLVTSLIERFNIKEGYVVDPFLGSGTTAISAIKNNLNFIGFEVNPFLAFLSSTKLKANSNNIDPSKLLDIIDNTKSHKSRTPKLSIVEKLFKENLPQILSSKYVIDHIDNETDRDFYKAVYLCALEKSSYAKKDGNGLKYPKNKSVLNFNESFKIKFDEMYSDSFSNIWDLNNSFIYNIDSRQVKNILTNKNFINNIDLLNNVPIENLTKVKGKVKLAVFSPPYMNCFDYTEVYKTELWMGEFVENYSDLKEIRNSSLSSHLNKSYIDEGYYNPFVNYFSNLIKEKKTWDKKIPMMITEYFHDMHSILEAMYLLLEKNAKCVVVVGNSAYSSVGIPTDLILANIAHNIGFRNIEIEIARNLGTSSQQYKSIDDIKILRESLIILTR